MQRSKLVVMGIIAVMELGLLLPVAMGLAVPLAPSVPAAGVLPAGADALAGAIGEPVARAISSDDISPASIAEAARQPPIPLARVVTKAAVPALPSLPAPDLPPTPDPVSITERYIPRPAGVEKDMTFFFGPFVIPPGQDNNRINVDVPVNDGVVTAIAPNLIDAVTGFEPSMLDTHIHHAHWFRVSNDPGDEYYTLNLAWVFGTGEEKTQGSFDTRAAAEPGGPRYGIEIPGSQPQVMIFMIHNKVNAVQHLYITLSVHVIAGTADAIHAATDCGPLPLLAGETCAAGQVVHPVKGKLWGSTFDVPRQANGNDNYIYPPGNRNGVFFAAPQAGMLIATAGHLHPNGKEVVIANLGKAGSGCDADLDGDGYAGITLFHSLKLEHVAAAYPHSEDYQMAATKFGFRAPIREGDRIAQFGVYSNKDFASYGAMSFEGVYIDRAVVPPALPAEGCTLADMGPTIIGPPDGAATEGIVNHAWSHLMPLCGPGLGPACDIAVRPRSAGLDTPAVTISAFAYTPGDMGFSDPLGAPPRVHVGSSLTFVNSDVGIGVRHTVTSCAWPCNGPYVANYPQPDGRFDSGKLGNLDPIDGAPSGDTVPAWSSPTDLAAGLYSYYCRIHPRMRGTFEVLP